MDVLMTISLGDGAMILEINSYRSLSTMVKNSANLAEILEKAEIYCRNCESTSPITCVERCEIWKAKNEFLKINKIVSEKNYVPNLFNVVKNKRRLRILDALSKHPRGTKELQKYLKNNGYYHSRHTIISEYLKPLLKAGLVKEGNNRYRLTLYGRKFHDMVSRFNFRNVLPVHSRCYEESVLKKLLSGPKTYDELVGSIAQESLSRAIRRLREKGLIKIRSKRSDYVFYFKRRKEPDVRFSPTEKRVFDAIPEDGISVRKLSKEVGITIRRTYKYLHRLREKKLVFARKRPRTYKLTSSGRKIAKFLEETTNFALAASKAVIH